MPTGYERFQTREKNTYAFSLRSGARVIVFFFVFIDSFYSLSLAVPPILRSFYVLGMLGIHSASMLLIVENGKKAHRWAKSNVPS